MKKKFVLGATLAFVLAGGVLTGCSTAHAALAAAYTPQAGQPATTAEANVFASPNITVSEAAWQTDQIPASAIPAEEAAQIGARYLWDVFGVDIDGMHVVMLYSDCWLRPSAGRWTGVIYRTEEQSLVNAWLFGDGRAVITPMDADVNTADRRFIFTIDSTTGERLEIASHSNIPPAPILHDTQPLWESTQGRAIQAMSDNQLAAFIGLTPEQLEVYTQEATAFAEAHFNTSVLQSVELGMNFVTPNGTRRLQGIQPLLDTHEDGSIFGTLSGIEFTATDSNGREAIITMSIRVDSISIRSTFAIE